MRINELEQKLLAEGCSKSNFSIGKSADDCYCITKDGNKWIVYYSERGNDDEPIFRSEDEEMACEFYFKHITEMTHLHIVGFYKQESDAISLENKLSSIAVTAIRNDIPTFSNAKDSRYRVFVKGKDIFKFIEAFGEPVINFD